MLYGTSNLCDRSHTAGQDLEMSIYVTGNKVRDTTKMLNAYILKRLRIPWKLKHVVNVHPRASISKPKMWQLFLENHIYVKILFKKMEVTNNMSITLFS